MSTASKLNPNLRTRRADRVAAAKELRAVRGPNAPLCRALADYIDVYRKIPFVTAAQKDATVKGIMARATEEKLFDEADHS
jgi:hypothetical protein